MMIPLSSEERSGVKDGRTAGCRCVECGVKQRFYLPNLNIICVVEFGIEMI